MDRADDGGMEDLVQAALERFPEPWRLIPGMRLPRLGGGIGPVLVSDRAILVFAGSREAAGAAALDLADFHAGCRGMPVLPVALLAGERVVAQYPLPLEGAAPPIGCSRLLLPGLLAHVAGFPPKPGFDPAGWELAPYRPVPALMGAACALYARHDVASLALASSGRGALGRTRAAIEAASERGRQSGRKQVVFVTGDPGAGKTLCGLDVAFAQGAGAALLTGNPALLHVLRAALVRDAAARGMERRAAVQRVHAVIQPLHAFRDHYVPGGVPPDRVLVIDEAQRCWTAAYAVRKTVNKAVRLSRSEPGHILEIMDRQEGSCLVLCLLGGGQEIHAGEGGIAGWGEALLNFPHWDASAPPGVLVAVDPRQRLPAMPNLRVTADLHLGDAVRAFAAPGLLPWVEAVLRSDAGAARQAAGAAPPARVTRSFRAMQARLGVHRSGAGLVASAGGRRLRAEGLGGLLWHQDENAVARWFLDRWPDIRSAEALEVAATEYGVQGLELERVGVCWDLDFRRRSDGAGWDAHAFRGTAWSRPLRDEAASNACNTYRVLLTRARRETIIWVPWGDARDPTRSPDRYDAIADFLLQCGAGRLDEAPGIGEHASMPEPVLL